MKINPTFAYAAIVAATLTMSNVAMAAEKVTLIVSGVEKIIYLPASLAQRLGYFREQGLDVELLSEPVGNEAEDELLSGVADGAVGFYDHTIDLQARGNFLQSIVLIGRAPGEAELVSTGLAARAKSPADLSGLVFGVTGLGSSTVFLTKYLAQKQGTPIKEMSIVPVGAGDNFVSAMQQGQIDIGMTTEPTISRVLNLGAARILVDLRTPDSTRAALGGAYPAACLYVQASWLKQHRAVAQRLANAFVKALRFIDTHTAAEIAERVPSEYYAGDKDAYVKALGDGKIGFAPDGRMPVDGPPNVLAVLSSLSQTLREKTIDLSKTYTNEFVDAVK